MTQRFCQRWLAMYLTLDRVTSLAQVPAVIARYLTANGLPAPSMANCRTPSISFPAHRVPAILR